MFYNLLIFFTITFIFFTETADVSILRFPGAKFGKILCTRTMRTKGILVDITDANIKIRIYINKNRYFRLPFDGFVLFLRTDRDLHVMIRLRPEACYPLFYYLSML